MRRQGRQDIRHYAEGMNGDRRRRPLNAATRARAGCAHTRGGDANKRWGRRQERKPRGNGAGGREDVLRDDGIEAVESPREDLSGEHGGQARKAGAENTPRARVDLHGCVRCYGKAGLEEAERKRADAAGQIENMEGLRTIQSIAAIRGEGGPGQFGKPRGSETKRGTWSDTDRLKKPPGAN